MVTTNQEPSLKELLDKTQIRTMKKDIAKLKQAVALQEKEKTSKINPVKPAVQNKVVLPNKEQVNTVKIPVTPTLHNVPVKESNTVNKIEPVVNKENVKTPIVETKQNIVQKSDSLKNNQNIQTPEPKKDLEQSIKQEPIKIQETEKKELPKESIATPVKMAQTNPMEAQDKEYLKGVPMAAKEKLQESAKTEETQRRKFIEDVEKWAQEKDNNTNKE